ncbi:hypothetical protein H6504_00955 [Candidatus Woesearchaeota archaeon]|nr:hypothetical protein [Candidatus Woesearchaeota archaeon]
MFSRKIAVLSTKFENLDGLPTARKYLGRKVFSTSGLFVGKVNDLVFKHNALAGVIVSGRYRIFVDKEYFSSDTDDAIMLSIDPILFIIGKQVFDVEGRKLGKVVGLEKGTADNSFGSLLVRKNIISKVKKIPRSHISICKENIILSKAYP